MQIITNLEKDGVEFHEYCLSDLPEKFTENNSSCLKYDGSLNDLLEEVDIYCSLKNLDYCVVKYDGDDNIEYFGSNKSRAKINRNRNIFNVSEASGLFEKFEENESIDYGTNIKELNDFCKDAFRLIINIQ